MRGVGKRVGDQLYVHVSAIEHLGDVGERTKIREAFDRLPTEVRAVVNVAKLNARSGRVSLLEYAAFDDDPFPALANSWTSGETGITPTLRAYGDSLNPPILHRKELLVHESHPLWGRWSAMTAEAESLGLFDDTQVIGFRMNWERLIASRGYQLQGGVFVPLANANVIDADEDGEEDWAGRAVKRHLTALARSVPSAPVQLLLRLGLLSPESTFFDYGCGRGDDVAALRAEGFSANGWDPYFAADEPRKTADVVNVGFVVNVVEDPAERVEVLQQAFALAKGVVSVGVMLHGSDPPGRRYQDGFITSRGTFQKYFSQSELKDYIEHALHQEAFLVGPGVAVAFKDKEWEQRFVAGRHRRRDVSRRLLAARARKLKAPARERAPSPRSRPHVEPEKPHPLLHDLWRLSLDLGRQPEESEVERLPEIVHVFGTLGRALRKMAAAFDSGLLEEARAVRTDDLRLYFALQQFSKRPRYRQLEARLQRDVKAFFRDYGTAQAAGVTLLTQAASPEILLYACREAASKGLGWLEGEHLQLHVSLVERLPVALRTFVSCGLLAYGDLSEVDLMKVHAGSAKLTLMQFEDFSSSPMPLMTRRVKVNVRMADYDVFDYGGQYPKPHLYRKSRYMHEEMPGYVEQQAFDEALEATGVLDDSKYGPSAQELGRELSRRRLEVDGVRLRRSSVIPDLDDACGTTFTYRQLIECGETQARLRIPNLPLNPETYNALFDLVTKLLDPLVDYFGSIRLTYGFCSPELGPHIASRVAPDLDQHAACEFNRRGKLICARGGAACDFFVENEDMRGVAEWVLANLPFDRMYFYGDDRPIHLSYAPSEAREAFEMRRGPSGRLLPRRFKAPM